jgi:hypothetical protein
MVLASNIIQARGDSVLWCHVTIASKGYALKFIASVHQVDVKLLGLAQRGMVIDQEARNKSNTYCVSRTVSWYIPKYRNGTPDDLAWLIDTVEDN